MDFVIQYRSLGVKKGNKNPRRITKILSTWYQLIHVFWLPWPQILKREKIKQ